VLAATDAVILGTRVDGVVLVNRFGRTRRREMQRAAAELRRMQVNLMGVVLNRLSRRGGGYYNRYYYYQSEDGERKKGRRWRFWLRRLRQPREESDEQT
jgi:Mrp family chromosome partitioning ATPase